MMTYGRGFREGSIVQTGRKASHQNSILQNKVFNPSNSKKLIVKEKSRQEKRNNSEEKQVHEVLNNQKDNYFSIQEQAAPLGKKRKG